MGKPFTPPPWGDDMIPPIKAGDDRVRINGAPPVTDIRLISEANFQYAVACVNALQALHSTEHRRFEKAMEKTEQEIASARESIRAGARRSNNRFKL